MSKEYLEVKPEDISKLLYDVYGVPSGICEYIKCMVQRLEAIDNSEPSEALECLDRIDNTLCLNNIKGKLEFGIDTEGHIDCDSVIGMTEDLETIKQALLKAEINLGARRNGKTLEQMYQLVKFSRPPMKPAIWVAKIDGKLEQRVIMEKDEYEKLTTKSKKATCWDIVVKKNVDVGLIKKLGSAGQYNSHKWDWIPNLTKEEFDTLKRGLESE